MSNLTYVPPSQIVSGVNLLYKNTLRVIVHH